MLTKLIINKNILAQTKAIKIEEPTHTARHPDTHSKAMDDDFKNTGHRSSIVAAAPQIVDPYHMDFTKLAHEYEEESTMKVPFAKSSFVHYSKCPRNMRINGTEYNDLVLTMELIQVPTELSNTQLLDPQALGKLEK